MKNKSGLVIAAAFIGPGTVTTASLAGAQTGMHLAWALLFSILATCVLQDMIVRLSFATQSPLADTILNTFSKPWIRRLLAFLIFAAIGVGNAAYQSGNLTGAAIGLFSATGIAIEYWTIFLGVIAAVLILAGSFRWVMNTLVCLVALMSLVFLITLVAAKPDLALLAQQSVTPLFDSSILNIVLALIGTTIVPYSLFLHASLINTSQATDNSKPSLRQLRYDSLFSILGGGVISLVIMATASIAFFEQGITLTPGNIGNQLAPVLGDDAKLLFGVGLFAAGITSAITAPMAAGYAITSLMKWNTSLSGRAYKTIALCVIVVGATFASLGIKPITLIVIAQATNALLLPIVVALILFVVSRATSSMNTIGDKTITAIGTFIQVFLVALGGYKLWSLL